MRSLRMTFVIMAATTTAAQAQVTFFSSHLLFQQNNDQANKILKGIETFEESTENGPNKTFFPNPLQNGTPRPSFPNGIDAENLILQTNITQSPSPAFPNPSNNPNALWVNGPGFLGSNSVKIGTDEFLNNMFSSIDLIFTSEDKTAIGLDVSTYQQFNNGHNGFIFTVYDTSNNILGVHLMNGATPVEPAKNFFGVWSPVPIGRVNVWGIFNVPQPFAVDNIEMWTVPEPGSAALLGVAALFITRRWRQR